MAAVATVRKVDNIGRICVPVDMLRALGICKGEEVDVFAEDGKIIIQKHESDTIISDIKSVIRKYEFDGCCFQTIMALEKVIKEHKPIPIISGDVL